MRKDRHAPPTPPRASASSEAQSRRPGSGARRGSGVRRDTNLEFRPESYRLLPPRSEATPARVGLWPQDRGWGGRRGPGGVVCTGALLLRSRTWALGTPRRPTCRPRGPRTPCLRAAWQGLNAPSPGRIRPGEAAAGGGRPSGPRRRGHPWIEHDRHHASPGSSVVAVVLVTGKSPLRPASLGLEGVTCGRGGVIREFRSSSQTVPLLPSVICPEPDGFPDAHFKCHSRIHSLVSKRALCLTRGFAKIFFDTNSSFKHCTSPFVSLQQLDLSLGNGRVMGTLAIPAWNSTGMAGEEHLKDHLSSLNISP